MPSKKEIRQKLWQSLDMAYVKMWLVLAALCTLIMWVFFRLTIQRDAYHTLEQVVSYWLVVAMVMGPIFGFCVIRTISLFRHVESYHFCKANLCNPKGGRVRDTIKFTVLIEDADGGKFVADTHSIFSTHKDLTGLGFEDYVNQKVTIAYNEETGNVVVIG